MSDFVLIASTPAACTTYSPYGTYTYEDAGLCEPLKSPTVGNNCCVTKIVEVEAGVETLQGAIASYNIWDATAVTGATGILENDCGFNDEGGYGTSAVGQFFVNFGCTIELTISGLFPKRKRYPDDHLILVLAWNLTPGNHGSWSPVAPAPSSSNADYICTSSSTLMQMFIRSVEATEDDESCCYPDRNFCPDQAAPPSYYPCTYEICENYYEPTSMPTGYVCSTVSRSYVWTYTCDVPCGVLVEAMKYDEYYGSCRRGAYVDMTIATTSSKCAI